MYQKNPDYFKKMKLGLWKEKENSKNVHMQMDIIHICVFMCEHVEGCVIREYNMFSYQP